MQEFEKEFIDFGVNIFKDFGLDSLSANLISILYLEPKEVSMEYLSEKTGYSLASISNKLKLLEGIGMIQKIKKPGTKKVFCFMEKNLGSIMKKKFATAYQKEILPAKNEIPKIIAKYKNTKMNDTEKKKMAIISNYHHQILKLEKMFMEMNSHLDKI